MFFWYNKDGDIMYKGIKATDRIIIFVILLIVIIPIFLHQMKLFKDRRLKETVNQIAEIISNKNDNSNEVIKYTLDKGFMENNDLSISKGKGIAFVDPNKVITVIFGYKEKCAIKFSFSDTVYLQNNQCDNFELIKGIKSQIVISGDGLYKLNSNTYRYQGYNVNNYLEYSNMLWRIMEINNNSIKIVSENAISTMMLSDKEISNYLNNEFYESLNKNIKKKIELLSINDVIDSSLEGCKIGKYINCPSKSYLANNSTWLTNVEEGKGWYLYTDGNIYPDNINNHQDIRAVVYLDKDIKIINGMGTVTAPYIINETILNE